MRREASQIQKNEAITPAMVPTAAPMERRPAAEIFIMGRSVRAEGLGSWGSVPGDRVLGVLGRLLRLTGRVLHVFAGVLDRSRGLVPLALVLQLRRVGRAPERLFALAAQFLDLVRQLVQESHVHLPSGD